MRLRAWLGRHRALVAFAAGVGLTLGALAAVGYGILADQRRAARLLAAALSRAFAREVRIERLTDVGTGRVVMRGVELPPGGGWPARLTAERVEATGPLVAAAKGEAAPLRVVVERPRIEVPAGAVTPDLAAVERAREALVAFLGAAPLLDVAVTGGVAHAADGAVEFDLVLRKGRDEARGQLTLRGQGQPLVVDLEARLDGDRVRLAAAGRGALAALAAWVPGARDALTARELDLRLEGELRPAAALEARGRLALGEVLAAEAEAHAGDGVLEVAVPRARVDLAGVAGLAGLAWRPGGQAEVGEAALTWRPAREPRPTVRAAVRLPTLRLPAAAAGTELAAEQVEARLLLEPAAPGWRLGGEGRVGRLAAAGLTAAPAAGRYEVLLDGDAGLRRATLEGVRLRLEGAALEGAIGYDGPTRRIDGRLGGRGVEVADLVRRVAPGWLEAGDRLALGQASVEVHGVDPGLRAGEARLEGWEVLLRRPAGDARSRRLMVRAAFAPGGVRLDVASDGVRVPGLAGEVAHVGGSAELARGSDGALAPRGADLAARDGQGRDLVRATLTPGAGPGRFRLVARAPALDRLAGLWPEARTLNGAASLDVQLAGSRAADGRLRVEVSEAELRGGRVSVRELAVDLPVRRGAEFPGEPPWGSVRAAEVIAYGVVVRDLAAPARLWNDRLSLNELGYDLYGGEGHGWVEVAAGPAGLAARGRLQGERVRLEELMSAYGVRGGTMTGLLRFDLAFQSGARLHVTGRLEVPEGGTVNIELLDRVLRYAEADPTGFLRQTIASLRTFEYRHAEAEVRTGSQDIVVSVRLERRERWLERLRRLFAPTVQVINIHAMPLSFIARQFPGS